MELKLNNLLNYNLWLTLRNVLNIHQKDEKYSHPYSSQVRMNSGGQGLEVETTQGLVAAKVRVWVGAKFKVWWWLG